jgi:hypothetical protein
VTGEILSDWEVWLNLSIQTIGILATILARLGEGSDWQTCCQRLFIVSLAMVGFVTVVAAGWLPGCYTLSGVTLSVMIVSAVFDRGGDQKVVVW